MKTFGQMKHYLPQYTWISGSSLLDLVKDRDNNNNAIIMPEPNIARTDLHQTDQITASHYHNNHSSSCKNALFTIFEIE